MNTGINNAVLFIIAQKMKCLCVNRAKHVQDCLQKLYNAEKNQRRSKHIETYAIFLNWKTT